MGDLGFEDKLQTARKFAENYLAKVPPKLPRKLPRQSPQSTQVRGKYPESTQKLPLGTRSTRNVHLGAQVLVPRGNFRVLSGYLPRTWVLWGDGRGNFGVILGYFGRLRET